MIQIVEQEDFNDLESEVTDLSKDFNDLEDEVKCLSTDFDQLDENFEQRVELAVSQILLELAEMNSIWSDHQWKIRLTKMAQILKDRNV